MIEKTFSKQPIEVTFKFVSCLQHWRIQTRKDDQKKLEGLLATAEDWLRKFRTLDRI